MKKNRTIILALFLVFTLPMLGAWLLYTSGIKLFNTKINHGQLIEPPIQLNQVVLHDALGIAITEKNLRGKWTMAYVAPANCNDLCAENLFKMRQIRLELGADQLRIQRLLMVSDRQSMADVKKLLSQMKNVTLAVNASPETIQKFLMLLPQKNLALHQGGLYLADPLGNVMMVYTADAEPSGIYKDLKHLLRVSQIG